jgi:hypothetical protein
MREVPISFLKPNRGSSGFAVRTVIIRSSGRNTTSGFESSDGEYAFGDPEGRVINNRDRAIVAFISSLFDVGEPGQYREPRKDNQFDIE